MAEMKNVLRVEHVTMQFGGVVAVDDLSMEVNEGEIVALIGPNGAGKTTLMKCVLGLTKHEGTVTLDGAAIDHASIDRLSFATCEHSFFPALTPAAHRDFYAAHFPRFNGKRFQSLMDFFSLPMDKKLRSFSAGMQNQFEVIMSLSQGADYILMDEPFAGNDIFNREDFYKVLLGILTEQETVLLLGDDVVNKTVPLILCAEENVEGTHGATIGALYEDTLFYFESRGFDRAAAESLMARAAVERLAHDLGDEATAETVLHELNGGV